MKCEKCGIHEATTHITKVINGKMSEGFFCNHCAASFDSPSISSLLESNFDNFFGGLWGTPLIQKSKETDPSLICQNCGCTLQDIQNNGRLGCSECYNVFGEFLKRPLKEIHGAFGHIGKIPKRTQKDLHKIAEIEKLKKQLGTAVAEQNFEQAAVLRDAIRQAERN